ALARESGRDEGRRGHHGARPEQPEAQAHERTARAREVDDERERPEGGRRRPQRRVVPGARPPLGGEARDVAADHEARRRDAEQELNEHVKDLEHAAVGRAAPAARAFHTAPNGQGSGTERAGRRASGAPGPYAPPDAPARGNQRLFVSGVAWLVLSAGPAAEADARGVLGASADGRNQQHLLPDA